MALLKCLSLNKEKKYTHTQRLKDALGHTRMGMRQGTWQGGGVAPRKPCEASGGPSEACIAADHVAVHRARLSGRVLPRGVTFL